MIKSICKHCKEEILHYPSIHKDFCDRKCDIEYKKGIVLLQYNKGQLVNRTVLKRILIQTTNNCCSICNISEWHGKRLSLELDHIDGNAGNNLPTNLRLLCPNCHSQTDTFKSKNIGNGRKSRGLPLY